MHLLVLLTLLVLPVALCSLCQQGQQFWDSAEDRCVPCTRCTGHNVVLVPCQVHRDTRCGPLSQLRIDWSWMKEDHKRTHHKPHQQDDPAQLLQEPHHKHQDLDTLQHQVMDSHQHHHRKQQDIDTLQHHHDTLQHHKHQVIDPPPHHKHQSLLVPAAQVKQENVTHELGIDDALLMDLHEEPVPETEAPLRVNETLNAPFSATETLVWDWQAGVLAVGVFSCLLFFLLVAVFSLYQARQWRRLRNSFDSDPDEVSAHTSLFTTDQSENSTEPPGFYSSNQCLYMDQLLVRKKQAEGATESANVYVDEAPASPVPNDRSRENARI